MFHPKGPTLLELIKQALSSTKRGYDLLAPKFDLTPFLTPDIVLKAAAGYLRAEREYHDAIDLCTGTGAGISALLPIVRKRIVGVDWSAPMLEEARKKFDAISSAEPKVILVCDDAFNIRYREIFDLATCFGALSHIERSRQKNFVSVVHSALRPGGHFAFITSEKPRWHSLNFWLTLGFDAVMRVRNILLRPQFVMYYLTFVLPEALALFDKKRWSSAKVIPMEVVGKSSPLRLVIATKR